MWRVERDAPTQKNRRPPETAEITSVCAERLWPPAKRLLIPPVAKDRRFGEVRGRQMPVLVLNASLQPLSVIHERRLVVLLSKQKVAFVDDNVRA